MRERYTGYQWVIETHIDNGIPHAHIVVNSSNPVDGRKIHLDDDDVQADARWSSQRICRDYGYSAFDNFKFSRRRDGAWYARLRAPTDAARSSSGGAPGSPACDGRPAPRTVAAEEACDRRDARRYRVGPTGLRTWPAFERRLAEKGYRINVNRRGVLTFYPPEGKGIP